MAGISMVTMSLSIPKGKDHWVAEVHAKASGINVVVATATGPTAAKAEQAAQNKASAKARRHLAAKAKRDAKKRKG